MLTDAVCGRYSLTDLLRPRPTCLSERTLQTFLTCTLAVPTPMVDWCTLQLKGGYGQKEWLEGEN